MCNLASVIPPEKFTQKQFRASPVRNISCTIHPIQCRCARTMIAIPMRLEFPFFAKECRVCDFTDAPRTFGAFASSNSCRCNWRDCFAKGIERIGVDCRTRTGPTNRCFAGLIGKSGLIRRVGERSVHPRGRAIVPSATVILLSTVAHILEGMVQRV